MWTYDTKIHRNLIITSEELSCDEANPISVSQSSLLVLHSIENG